MGVGDKRPRVRREMRSLTKAEEVHFVEALKEMMRAGESRSAAADAERRFGQRFRSYAYLSVKHSIAALHPKCDQGHLAANQIAFHRALLLEFELSLLSVIETRFPNSTLEALPYWNWARDVKTQGGLLDGSLWRLWGSPYGDPDNKYCINDPVFKMKIPNVESDLFTSLLADRLGPELGSQLANGYGFRRSPWSNSDCPGIARNPGWVLGIDAPIETLWSNASFPRESNSDNTVGIGDDQLCLSMSDFGSFARCIQGQGYIFGGSEFGPHNVPHIFIGTIYDEDYGVGLLLLLTSTLACVVGALIGCMVLSFVCITRLEIDKDDLHIRNTSLSLEDACNEDDFEQPPHGKTPRMKKIGLIFTSFWLAGAMFCMFAAEQAFPVLSRGPANMASRVRWSKLFSGSTPGDFSGKDWRSDQVRCPSPASCKAKGLEPRKCLCSSDMNHFGAGLLRAPLVIAGLQPGAVRYAGSDFWDGAFSSNENFFYPLHAFGDLLHFKWSLRHNTSIVNDFGGVSLQRTAECYGTALKDVISEEMCFTAQDVGMSALEESPDSSRLAYRSSKFASSQEQSCITMRDLFNFTIASENADETASPYTYDVIAEPFTWQAREAPGPIVCPPASTLCEREAGGLERVILTGSIECRRSEDFSVAHESHCISLGRRRPRPPIRICDCTAQTFQERALDVRSKQGTTHNRTKWRVSVILVCFAIVFMSATPFICCVAPMLRSAAKLEKYTRVSQS